MSRYAPAHRHHLLETANLDLVDIASKHTELLWTQALRLGPTLLLAIVTLVVGLWVIRRLTRFIDRAALLRNADATVSRFMSSAVSVLLKTLLFVSVASMLGVATTSFVAIIGAAGLAIGLALQGNLANVAGGLVILIFKPFRVGEYVEAQGVNGTVTDIEIFHTIIRTQDNKLVVIPNGVLSNGIITNFTREPQRAVEWHIGVSYDDDLVRAKQVIADLAAADTRVLREPVPLIVVNALGDSAVQLLVRVWVARDDYWNVRFDLLERIKLKFDEEGLVFPFPPRVVHVREVGQVGRVDRALVAAPAGVTPTGPKV